MDGISSMLAAIPAAARSALSIVAFLAIVIAWSLLAMRSRRLSTLLRSNPNLPPEDLREIIKTEMGQPVPPTMDPEGWIRHQRQKYFFIAFLTLVAAGLVFYAMYKANEDDGGGGGSVQAERAALMALALIYTRKDDNHLYDMSSDLIRQTTGSLAEFRGLMNEWTAQLIEVPVQRKKISLDATADQAAAIFDAETDSGMRWREQVSLAKINHEWKIAWLNVTPSEWLTKKNVPLSMQPTLTAFFQANASTDKAYGIPASGWEVTVAATPAPTGDKYRCDLIVSAENQKALLHSVYGGCSLKIGTKISIMGIARVSGDSVEVEQVRFTLSNPPDRSSSLLLPPSTTGAPSKMVTATPTVAIASEASAASAPAPALLSIQTQWFPSEIPLPPPVDLNIPNIPQETPVWCWAAVAQQLIQASVGPERTPAQCALVAMANGAPPETCCIAPNPNCMRTGTHLQVAWLIQQFGGHTSSYAPPTDPFTLYRTLAAGHPILLQVRTGMSSHVVVLKGMSFEPTPAGLMPMLHINDPLSYFTAPVPYWDIVPFWVDALVVN